MRAARSSRPSALGVGLLVYGDVVKTSVRLGDCRERWALRVVVAGRAENVPVEQRSLGRVAMS
jgi:hypothetical protein